MMKLPLDAILISADAHMVTVYLVYKGYFEVIS